MTPNPSFQRDCLRQPLNSNVRRRQSNGGRMFEHGDLVFSQIGSDANAISAVTEGYRGARVNHMGVVVKNHKGFFVLEAYPPEVRVTQLDVFLRRSSDNS